MKKENQRIRLTKRLLKEAIVRILQQKPLKKITITELCEEAGINRITFYRHYTTPHDVLEDMGRDMFKDILKNLERPNSLDDFERYIEDMCTYLYERSDTVLLLLRQNSDLEAFDFIQKLYSTLMDEYQNLPELKGFDKEDLRLMTTYFGGGGYFLLRQWLTEDIHKSPKEIASLVYQLTCNGEFLATKTKEIMEKNFSAYKKRIQ